MRRRRQPDGTAGSFRAANGSEGRRPEGGEWGHLPANPGMTRRDCRGEVTAWKGITAAEGRGPPCVDRAVPDVNNRFSPAGKLQNPSLSRPVTRIQVTGTRGLCSSWSRLVRGQAGGLPPALVSEEAGLAGGSAVASVRHRRGGGAGPIVKSPSSWGRKEPRNSRHPPPLSPTVRGHPENTEHQPRQVTGVGRPPTSGSGCQGR